VVDDPGQPLGLGRLEVAVAHDLGPPVPHRCGVVRVATAQGIDERLDVAAQRVDAGRHAAADIHHEHEVDHALGLRPGLRHGRGLGRFGHAGVSVFVGAERFGGGDRVHASFEFRRAEASAPEAASAVPSVWGVVSSAFMVGSGKAT
jgi:hypothetical protein